MRFYIVGNTREDLYKRFIFKATEIHGGKYDYSLVNYVNSRSKVNILCKAHSFVFDQRPSAHLQGAGCPICGAENSVINSYIGFDKYAEVINTYPNTVPFSVSCANYLGIQKSIATVHCSVHGDENIKLSALYQRSKRCVCSLCNSEHKRVSYAKSFIENAEKVHKGKYDYSLVLEDYVSSSSKVRVICKEHGVFKQKPNGHLNGKGCFDCARLLWGRWSPSCLDKNPDLFKNENCVLYLAKIYTPTVAYYKIGITKDVDVRFKLIKWEASEITTEVISEYHSNTYHCSELEHELFDKLSDLRKPCHIKFGGYTECFKLDSRVPETYNSIIDKAT